MYDYPNIPPGIRAALEAYRLENRPLGGFLRAVVENDLTGAICRADEANRQPDVLRDLALYRHNALPSPPLNHEAWTECRCHYGEVRPGVPTCLVHSWDADMVRAATI